MSFWGMTAKYDNHKNCKIFQHYCQNLYSCLFPLQNPSFILVKFNMGRLNSIKYDPPASFKSNIDFSCFEPLFVTPLEDSVGRNKAAYQCEEDGWFQLAQDFGNLKSKKKKRNNDK